MNKYKGICESILDTVGNTPIIRLNKVTQGLKCEILAKLEFFNPMGSVKDRIAKYILEKAEREGTLKDNQLIIENSSGNTAMGLALMAIQKGYKLKVVVRDNLSKEKKSQLLALGVELLEVDHTLDPKDPCSYNNMAINLAKKDPDCYFPDQHNNLDNNECHYNTTGREIYNQCAGEIDYFVAGMGTGGTICGISKYLKEQNPNIKVIAVDPKGSVFFDYFKNKKMIKPSPYLIEGLGDEFIIDCPQFEYIDDMIQVDDKTAFTYARKLLKEEGVMAGGSSGSALYASIALAKKVNKKARIVTLFADSASRYLSTIFNDEWMKEKGFI